MQLVNVKKLIVREYSAKRKYIFAEYSRLRVATQPLTVYLQDVECGRAYILKTP